MAARGYIKPPETQFSFSCPLASTCSSSPHLFLCPFQSPVSAFSKVRSSLSLAHPSLLPRSHPPSSPLLFFPSSGLLPLSPFFLDSRIGLFFFCHKDAAVSILVMTWFTSLCAFSPPPPSFPSLPPLTYSPGTGFGAGGWGFVVFQ